MVKRRRRRRSAPTSEKTQKPKTKSTETTIPTVDKKEEQASKIKDVMPACYQKTSWDRLNSLDDYTKKMKPNRLESLIAYFYNMEPYQLQEAAKDKKANMLERSILKMIQISEDENHPKAIATKKYLLERMFGKPKKEIVLSGNVSQKLQYETKQVPDIEGMNQEQRDAFMDILNATEALPLKEITVEGKEAADE
jgi:hypothetical protein